MTAKLPTSKAKTAYGLLSDIARLALDEPKRMRMQIWGGVGCGDSVPQSERPACGTVGCIGGWTNVLRPAISAHSVLGLTDGQADELFMDVSLTGDTQQGTAPHARRVARHIAKFQKKYRAQLLAKKV